MGKFLWCIMTSREGSEEEARRTTETMRNCPHLVAMGYTSGTVYSVYMVPEHKRWWFEYPETLNEETGQEKYIVQVVENLTYPEELALKTQKSNRPPCGADCGTCRLRERYGCDGCPAAEVLKLRIRVEVSTPCLRLSCPQLGSICPWRRYNAL